MNLEDLLQELSHRVCLGATAQPETGGDLLLHFAGWQAYEEPPSARLLSTERGKWSLMLCSPWRLDGPTAVVCDWRSVADPLQESVEAYAAFEGLTVESVGLERPGLDLRIEFSREFVLKVQCDSRGRSNDCWFLLRPDDSSIAATRDFRLNYEPPPGGRHRSD